MTTPSWPCGSISKFSALEPYPWWRDQKPDWQWPMYEDFKVFLSLVWQFLNLPAPTRVQFDIADFLQYGGDKTLIEAFRGVGKSWVTAAYVIWLLMRNPLIKVMVVSATSDRAMNFTTFVKQLIEEMPELQHMHDPAAKRNSKVEFDIAAIPADQAPSVRSVSISGTMTGGRADLIIGDDVEVPNNSSTVKERDKLKKRTGEFSDILKPGGSIKYLGTPQCMESLYTGLEERGFSIRIWPGRYPKETQVANYKGNLAPILLGDLERDPSLVGRSTDPARFDDEDLLEREIDKGRSEFTLQFMLDTTLSDADRFPLKLSDLIVADINPDLGPEKVIWSSDMRYAMKDLPVVGFSGDQYYKPMDFQRDSHGNVLMRPFDGTIMAIDPSGRGADETGYAVVKLLNSQLFLIDAGHIPGGYDDEALNTIAAIARKFAAHTIVLESNFGDGMFQKLLEPVLRKHHPCTIEERRASKQKEKRIIETLEPVLNQHRLIVDTKLVRKDYDSVKNYPSDKQIQYRLFYQLTHITKDRGSLRHDDRLDALALAVEFLTEQMNVDRDAAVEAERQRRLDAELENFLELASPSTGVTAGGMDLDFMGGTGNSLWH